MSARVPTSAILRALVAAAALALASGCASGLQSVERSYVRGGLEEVPLRTIDVFAWVSGPPRVSPQRLDVKVFPPPALEQPLMLGQDDPGTTAALQTAALRQLSSAGFTVGLVVPKKTGRSPEPPAIGPVTGPVTGPVGRQPGAPVVTSTAVVTSTRALAALTPTPEVALEIGASDTLREVLAKSRADAVLVVRAVPVDRFYIDFGKGTHFEMTALGRERVEDTRPEPREGRLLLGQAFLFDRKTGVRLWTRQLPDFPDAGRLTPNHPMLAYGFVHDPTAGLPPPPEARVEPAAKGFAEAMLHDLPRPSAGTAAGRAKLDAVDVAREETVDAFLDEGHVAIDVGARWTTEAVELEQRLGGRDLAPLGTGALAPSGDLGVVPRVSYLTAGGLVFAAALPIATIPGSFSRTYHYDNPAPTLGDPDDRSATVRVNGGLSLGLELTLGQARALSRHLYLIPAVGLFAESLSFDATPGSVVLDTQRTRLGILGGVEALYRLGEGGPFFVRGGGHLRGGVDLQGGFGAGIDLSASLGVFL